MSSKICPICNTVCRPSARFCISCRHRFEGGQKPSTCAMGHKMDPTWDQCPFCQNAGSSTDWSATSPKSSAVDSMPMRRNTIVEPQLDAQNPAHQQVRHPQKYSPLHAESTRTANTCKKGHKQDPTWKECPFCKNLGEEDDWATLSPISPGNETLPRRSNTIVETPSATTESPTPTSAKRDHEVHSPTRAAQAKTIVGALTTFSLSNEGKAFLLRVGRNFIGSAAGAQIRLGADRISPKHAIIACNGEVCILDDCLSETGTWLNGSPVSEKTRLSHDDVIQTGDVLWRLSLIKPPNPNLKQT